MADDLHPIHALLAAADGTLEAQWAQVEALVERRFGREPTIESILFLIGVQERGRGFEPELEKDVKEALVMEGTYSVFETVGLYVHAGMEADGSWIWERATDLPPDLSPDDQHRLLRLAIIRYFDDLLDAAVS
ncbi:MAG: hypothetical protein GVY15_01085 [Bacteroidetes bacterium]|jgi:hypothetical protein|nr:hypothetical protein [Bacteroidota bacterium]